MQRCLLAALVFAACTLPAAAQVMSTESMIEQLQAAPRTRSLRNLAVEATDKPSVSLLVQFDFDSARVRPENEELLTNLAKALKSPQLAGSKFAVEGHTDAKGGADYNQKLSAKRAAAVRDLLVKKGVEPVRLMASGKGSTELANAADPLAAENRRVRVVNLD